MSVVTVALDKRAYLIHIGENLIDSLPDINIRRRVVVVTNTVVSPLYLERITARLQNQGIECLSLVLPDGESYKSSRTLESIYDYLLEKRCDRTTPIIALGGGVVGDIAGYAAATYQRGVPFIQIPTTLLAMVDSSVGGKTGINHARGKNMIGAFWQPQVVIADTRTLNTLPDRELSAGLAEVIKYGLIRDLPFLEWLESNIDKLVARESAALAYAIERSCINKAEVVAADEMEMAKEGGRALLNLGHTFGHAIETGLGYGAKLHGEAVAIGTVMASELSARLGWIARADIERIRALLIRAGLPVWGPKMGVDRYLDLMGHDKKVVAGRMRLVLLKQIGEGVTYADAPMADVSAAIEACCE